MSWGNPETVYNSGVNNFVTDLLDGMESKRAYGLVLPSAFPPSYNIDLKMVDLDGMPAVNQQELVEDLLALGMEADATTHAPKYYVFVHNPDTGSNMEVTYKVTLRFIFGFLNAEFNIWKYTPR
jgi:hypothetical protein